MYDGRFAAAVPLLEQASAASPAPAEWNLAYAYFYIGRTTKAETMLQQIGPRSARSHRRAQATLASFLAARNQIVDAQRLIDTVISGAYIDHHVAYSLGVAYAQLHKPREALVWLKQARTSGFPCYPWFEGDPLLAPLRDNREFKGFLEDFKEEWAMKKTQLAAVR
jgi:thioredoxin-like negative regulator of GroEL